MPTDKSFGSIFRYTLRRFRLQDAITSPRDERVGNNIDGRSHTAPPDTPIYRSSIDHTLNVHKASKTSSISKESGLEAQDDTNTSAEELWDESTERTRIEQRRVKQDFGQEGDYKETTDAENTFNLTYGEPRIVSALDGERECAAVLLNSNMVELIKDLERKSRLIKKLEEKLGESERDYLVIKIAIENKKHELEYGQSSSVQQAEIRVYIEAEKAKLNELQHQIDSKELEIKSERVHIDRWQWSVVNNISFAMKDANLLDPDEEEERESEENALDEPDEVNGNEARSSRTGTESVVTLEELARRNARDDLDFWREHHHNMWQRFNDREEYMDYEWRKFQQGQLEGLSTTQTEFDQAIVTEIGAMTRALIEAEKGLEDARSDARKLRALSAVNSFEQESNFYDQPDDGYRESFEAYMSQTAPVHVIETWLDHLIEEFPIIDGSTQFSEPQWEMEEGEREPDEWEVRSIGFASSIGAVADAPMRKRIDRWRVACGLDDR